MNPWYRERLRKMADNPTPGLTFDSRFNVSDKVFYRSYGTSTIHPAIVVEVRRFPDRPGKRQYRVIFSTGLDIGVSEMPPNVAKAYVQSQRGRKEVSDKVQSVPFVEHGELLNRDGKQCEIDALWPYIRSDFFKATKQPEHKGLVAMIWRANNPKSEHCAEHPVWRTDNEYPSSVLLLEFSAVRIERVENLVDAIDMFSVFLEVGPTKIPVFNAPLQVAKRISLLKQTLKFGGSDPLLLLKVTLIDKYLSRWLKHHGRQLNTPRVSAQNTKNANRFWKLNIR